MISSMDDLSGKMAGILGRVKILPRWIIVLVDSLILFSSTLLAYFLRFNFQVEMLVNQNYLLGLTLTTSLGVFAILVKKSHTGIVRYTGIEDGIRIFQSMALTSLLLCVLNVIHFLLMGGVNLIPYSVIGISFFTSFILLFFYRLFVKSLFAYYSNVMSKNTNVLIVGAGQTGIIAKQTIDNSSLSKLRVVGFLEKNGNKIGKRMFGTKIYGIRNNLEGLIEDLGVGEVIIATSRLSKELKNDLVDTCLKCNVRVMNVPPIQQWVLGELSINQIKEINIEELLGRESIELNNILVREELQNKCILITGAAGSIGSEIVRQIQRYNPRQLVLVDQAESPLYHIDREIRDRTKKENIATVIGDVTNEDRMTYVYKTYEPDVVFHAAAYKHVPMMENNPREAVLCNVKGTRLLADLAVKFGVDKFVMISTDKAVNPTSVMGASKRIAEIYVQALSNYVRTNNPKATSFITTRFGNVLGSNGSVIPAFRRQIESGGPVTVTHPEITRYFMTIPEACQLVLEAGTMGKGGEIFIFDMGKSIKIIDLAKKMIKLSGLELGKDIEIVFTGLREGEKLYEELLGNRENTIPTHHNKIMIAKVRDENYDYVTSIIDSLIESIQVSDELEMVSIMKKIIPEYISNYSKFEVLDNKEYKLISKNIVNG